MRTSEFFLEQVLVSSEPFIVKMQLLSYPSSSPGGFSTGKPWHLETEGVNNRVISGRVGTGSLISDPIQKSFIYSFNFIFCVWVFLPG